MTETNTEQSSQTIGKPASQGPTEAASAPQSASPSQPASTTTEDVITAREPGRVEGETSKPALKQKLGEYGEGGRRVFAGVWTWLNDLVSGRTRYELLPAGIYVLRLLGVVVAVASLVYPLIDLQVSGALGWFVNVVANVAAGFLALVAAEALATLRDIAGASKLS